MGQASVSSLLQAINSNYPTSSQLGFSMYRNNWIDCSSGEAAVNQVHTTFTRVLACSLVTSRCPTLLLWVSHAALRWTATATQTRFGPLAIMINEGMKRLLS